MGGECGDCGMSSYNTKLDEFYYSIVKVNLVIKANVKFIGIICSRCCIMKKRVEVTCTHRTEKCLEENVF